MRLCHEGNVSHTSDQRKTTIEASRAMMESTRLGGIKRMGVEVHYGPLSGW